MCGGGGSEGRGVAGKSTAPSKWTGTYGFPSESHSDIFLLLASLVGTVGVLRAACLAAVCDVHGGVALVAVRLPILAGDVSGSTRP